MKKIKSNYSSIGFAILYFCIIMILICYALFSCVPKYGIKQQEAIKDLSYANNFMVTGILPYKYDTTLAVYRVRQTIYSHPDNNDEFWMLDKKGWKIGDKLKLYYNE